MQVKYVTTSAPTMANVIADLTALLSGATIASLSSSCDKANTTMVNTVAPGWTVYDNAAPSGVNPGVVLTAPDLSGVTKYVRVYASTGSVIDILAYDSWNASTHAGTNPTTSQGNNISFTATGINTYWIFATPRSIYICYANGSNAYGTGAFEFTRDCAYLVGSTYQAVAVGSYSSLSANSATCNISRIKNLVGAGDVTPSNVYTATIAQRAGSSNQGSPSGALQDANGNYYHEIRPIWLMTSANAIVGKLCDVFEITKTAGNPFDTFSDGTDTYMIAYTGTSPTSSFAFKVA